MSFHIKAVLSGMERVFSCVDRHVC